jgi:hypothetical protein
MFSLDFRSTDGRKFTISKDLDLQIPLNTFGSNSNTDNESSVKFWILNTVTGRWELTSNIAFANPQNTKAGRKKGRLKT